MNKERNVEDLWTMIDSLCEELNKQRRELMQMQEFLKEQLEADKLGY